MNQPNRNALLDLQALQANQDRTENQDNLALQERTIQRLILKFRVPNPAQLVLNALQALKDLRDLLDLKVNLAKLESQELPEARLKMDRLVLEVCFEILFF